MCTSCGSKSMSLQGLKGDGVARVIQRPSRSNVFTFKPPAGREVDFDCGRSTPSGETAQQKAIWRVDGFLPFAGEIVEKNALGRFTFAPGLLP